MFVRLSWLNLLLGVLNNMGLDLITAILFFQSRLASLGWSSHPWQLVLADYTPIFPWFGVVLIGMFIAHLLEKKVIL